MGPYERINMKAEGTKLSKLATNSYLVWVSDYYRKISNGKEVRIFLFGDVFHVFFVNYDKENKKFNVELVHQFSKKYGKKVKPVKGVKDSIIRNYKYGKQKVHQIRGGYSEKDFEMERTNLDVILDNIFDGPLY